MTAIEAAFATNRTSVTLMVALVLLAGIGWGGAAVSWQMGAAAFLYAFVVGYFASRFYQLVRDMMR